MSNSAGPITKKIDKLIKSMDDSTQSQEEQKERPTQPEQDPSEFDITKPYRVVVREGNQGGAEKLVIENFDVDNLKLKDNELLIDIHASGINFIDTYHRSGLYPNVYQLGKEGGGIITNIGAKVDNYAVGDKVCWFSIQGSYATHIVTTNDNIGLMKIPDSLFKLYENDEEAVFDLGASVGIQALTAHYLCRSLFPVNNQTSVLVHAGAGGTGGLLIQICKHILKSPLVICTVGTDEKKKIALEYGADHAILYNAVNFVDEVMKLTNNNGVNVVFDGVGKATYEGSMKCTSVRGMCVFFGNASGAVPPIDPLLLTSHGSIFITRPTLGHYIQSAQELKFRYDELFAWMASKEVHVRIGRRFPLHNVFDAHTALETRQTVGKIILKKNFQHQSFIKQDESKQTEQQQANDEQEQQAPQEETNGDNAQSAQQEQQEEQQ